MRSSRRCRASALGRPCPWRRGLPCAGPDHVPGRGSLVFAPALSLRLGHGQCNPRNTCLDQVPLGAEAAQRNVLGEALEGRLGGQARPARPPPPAPPAHGLDDLAQRGAAVVLDVGRHLRPPAVGQVQARGRGHPPGRRPTRAGSAAIGRASSRSSLSRSRLKATSGGRAAARITPALGWARGGPKSGHDVAALQPLGQPLAPARAQVRPARVLGPGGQLAVEHHRHAPARRRSGWRR